jgi:hypothetical protein
VKDGIDPAEAAMAAEQQGKGSGNKDESTPFVNMFQIETDKKMKQANAELISCFFKNGKRCFSQIVSVVFFNTISFSS